MRTGLDLLSKAGAPAETAPHGLRRMSLVEAGSRVEPTGWVTVVGVREAVGSRNHSGCHSACWDLLPAQGPAPNTLIFLTLSCLNLGSQYPCLSPGALTAINKSFQMSRICELN